MIHVTVSEILILIFSISPKMGGAKKKKKIFKDTY